MLSPFQDDLCNPNGPSEMGTSSDGVSLCSEAVASDTATTLATIATAGPPNMSRWNTPVSSYSRDSKKAADESVTSLPSSRKGSHRTSNVDLELAVIEERKTNGSVMDDQQALASDGIGVVGPKVEYKTLGWVKAAFIMIAETVSLGILSLPRVLASLGLIPGVILIIVFGLIATYTGYVVYQFKIAHPEMATIAHGMEILFSRPGRWIAEVSQDLQLVFIMAAHIVIFSIAFNALTEHALCTTIFMAIGAATSLVVSLPRTMKGNSYFSMFSCGSIAIATMIALIGISISKPGYGDAHLILPANLSSLPDAAVAVSSIILAYNGHIAYPTIISEMREPRDFPKALILLETVAISFYIVVAVVIYTYAGQNVSAPALGSASPVIRKIAYAFAIPTIIVAGVIVALVAAKQLYKYVWRHRSFVMEEKSSRARWSWRTILLLIWAAAWLIACVIPIFGQLLGLIGALFGTWFALGFCSMFWLGMNWKGKCQYPFGKGWRKISLAALNIFIVVVCAVICVLGTYGTVKLITGSESRRKPFSCASNV